MRQTYLVLMLLFLLFFTSQEINACGDKFLVIGRGLRYERAYAAKHPASILLYVLDKDANKDLQTVLTKAGHKMKVTGSEAELFAALNAARYDVVLINLSDAFHLERKIMDSPSRPAVLPIIYKTSKSELEASASQYPCVLEYKEKNRNSVAVIDQVMGEKLKGKPVKCNWSK